MLSPGGPGGDPEFAEWKFAACVSACAGVRSRLSASSRAQGGGSWAGSWEARLGVSSRAGRGGGGFPSAFFFDSGKNCKNPQPLPPPLGLDSPGAARSS